MKHNPAVAAVTEIPPGRYRKLSGHEMYDEVISAFIDEWQIDPKDIDGLLVPPINMASAAATGSSAIAASARNVTRTPSDGIHHSAGSKMPSTLPSEPSA